MMSEIFAVMKYVGIPYKNMGRGIDGLDCWGLIKLLYQDILGFTLWDLSEEYPEDWSFSGKDLFMENYQKQWEKVEKPQMWDVVLFRVGGEIVNHAGVMLNQNTFIHCVKAGVVLNRISEKSWKKSASGFYRYKI
jgi:cell wall-associated NlpC family hydrolase